MKYICFVCFILGTLFAWSPPQNLGITGADDTNPQTIRVQLFDIHTCLVWQTDVNGNWDIFSRFSHWTNWDDTVRITTNNNADINPSVSYDYIRDCYWCVWQNNNAGNWDIYVSNGDDISGWSAPHQLTTDVRNDECPSVFADVDTVWVVWQSDSGILSSYYDGADWTGPLEIVSGLDNICPKINGRHNHPFVVWENYGDIYYSEYLNGSWENPQAITTDLHDDTNPEIYACYEFNYYLGVSVVWQSNRDGNEEIYCTAHDTLDVHYRMTFNDSADITPSPLYAIMIIRQEYPFVTAISSNRNGNYDIFTHFGYPWGDTLFPVDTDFSEDLMPVVTGGDLEVWVLWQTDRNEDWDIYGSYIYVGGIEDARINDCTSTSPLSIFPNPFREITDIRYEIESSQNSEVNLCIYDISGRMVKNFNLLSTIFNLQSKVIWDGRDDDGQRLPQGVYFVRLIKQSEVFTEKVVLIE